MMQYYKISGRDFPALVFEGKTAKKKEIVL